MSRGSAVVAVVAASVLGVGASALVAAATSAYTRAPEVVSDDVALRGCVVRFAPGGPYLHANPSHICVGLERVSTTSDGDLALRSAASASTTVTFLVSPDETLSGRGVDCGPIGGGRITVVRPVLVGERNS